MSNYKDYALREFRAAGWCNEYGVFKDEMQKSICEHVMKLLDVFSDEGHSGSSAPYAVDLFSKLALYKPVAPLTGEDWEWEEISIGDGSVDSVSVHQNKRCSTVFKQSDRFNGKPYYLDGKVFWEWYTGEDGIIRKSYFTSGDSLVPIEFPYTPHTEYVFLPTEKYPNESLIPMETYRGD